MVSASLFILGDGYCCRDMLPALGDDYSEYHWAPLGKDGPVSERTLGFLELLYCKWEVTKKAEPR